MKKSTMKVLSFVMALLMIVGTLAVVPFSADAGANNADLHTHTKGKFVDTVEPTCGLFGYSIYECADEECGQSFITDITEKLEHDWEEVGEVLATCDAKGHDAYYLCKNCGAKTLDPDTAVLLADDAEELNRPEQHDVAKSYKIYDPDDCTKGIYYVEYCKKCGKILKDDVLGIPVEEEKKHDLYAEVTVEPTCKVEGVANIRCKNCSFVVENVIVEKLAHTPVENKKDNWKTIPATFLDKEITYLPCALCGEIILNEDGEFDEIDENGDAKVNDKLVAKIGDSISEVLGYDLAADWALLKPGKSKTYNYEFDDEPGTFTLTKPACDHKYKDTLAYYGFEYEKQNGTETKKITVTSNDKDDDDNKIFASPLDFIKAYAEYADIADLYAVYKCEDDTKTGLPSNNTMLGKDYNVFKGWKIGCKEVNKVVLLNKVGHTYEDYNFEFKFDLNPEAEDDSSLVSYFHTFDGGFETVVYECGKKPVATSLCVFCAARGEDATTQEVGKTMEHKYVTVCFECETDNDADRYQIGVDEDEEPIYVYKCNNCTHERAKVCFNLVTDKETGERTAYCLDGLYKTITIEEEGQDPTEETVYNVTAGKHSFEAEDFDEDSVDPVDVAATCTTFAYQAYECTECGQLSDPIPGTIDEEGGFDSTNHDWTSKDAKVVTLVPATCNTKGTAYIICGRFSCKEQSDPVDLPIDPDAHDLRAPDGQVYTAEDEENGLIPEGRNVGDPKPDSVTATCTNAVMEKWFCARCTQVVYTTIEGTRIDAGKHEDKDGKSTLKNVKAVAATCTSNGNYAYTYCTACGVITEIDGVDTTDLEEPLTIEDNLDETVIAAEGLADVDGWIEDDAPLTFTERQWENVYAGDAKIEYETVKFANGSVMFYRITSGGFGHEMVEKEAEKDATCYADGQKARYICDVCGYKDPDRNGAKISKLGHPGAVEIARPDDEDIIKTGEVVVKSTELDKVAIWDLRGAKVKSEVTKSETFNEGEQDEYTVTYKEITYEYEYVESTCFEEGYIIGKYCPVCMGTIKVDGKEVPNDIFKNADGQVTNQAGYRIEKKNHKLNSMIEGTGVARKGICDKDDYGYEGIYTCTNCQAEYVVKGFVPAENAEHKAETYKKANAKLGISKGDDVIYTLALVEGEYRPIEKNEENGKYYFADTDTETEYPYIECVDAIYTGKRCVNCGKFIDVEVEIAPVGHKDIDDNDIIVTCKDYNVEQAGAVCVYCGKTLPKIVITKNEKGLEEIKYYNKEGGYLGEGQYLANDAYLEVAHDWAIPQNDCEAINADIIACAACGINIENKDAKPEDKIVHEYRVKVKGTGDNANKVVSIGKAAWDNEQNVNDGYAYFDNFIFFDVTYPTYTTEGTGVIYCENCGKELKVVLNTVGAEVTAKFDDDDIVIVGDVVTATVNISAKDYNFNTLIITPDLNDAVANKNRISLVAVEIVYDFAAADDVAATINKDGQIILRTTNKNVTINGENTPFLKLYFRTGDLTDQKAITEIKGVKIAGATAVRFNDEGKTENADAITLPVNKDFGTIKVYNPVYAEVENEDAKKLISATPVLVQIYSTEYTAQYDFNGDDNIDLDDYFAMVDFVDSAKTIADFCALTGYDVDAMLDGREYSLFSSQTSISTGIGKAEFSVGTEEDIAYAKTLIKNEMAKADYAQSIIEAGKTIAEFAQKVIDDRIAVH